MNLRDLLQASDLLAPHAQLSNVEVRGIVQDTRFVNKPGFVFVARRGAAFDGYQFVEKALALGAVAVLGEASDEEVKGYTWYEKVPHIHVQNDKIAVAKLAAAFYGHPSDALYSIGVTGTDGKTTTSYLLHHLLSGSYKTGLLSTAGVRLGGEPLELPGHFTTPEAPQVQDLLAQFRNGGCSHAVIESSSHGFAMHRLDEVNYNIGVWTNLSPEHLDYHRTLEAYRDAKATLMRRAEVSILNADDPAFSYFAGEAGEVIRYAIEAQADWRAVNVQQETGYLKWELELKGERIGTATLPMIGRYNIYNALAALAAAHQTGIEVETLLGRLTSFPGVPGRMQLVQRSPFTVVVDFAHTAPALEKALQAVRPQTKGRLIVVIGAAGERDPGKRAPLGRVAVQYADLAIFTEEDSRSEEVEDILAEMVRGAREVEGKGGFRLEPDRRNAIYKATASAHPGDLILLAGKGHEATLERKDETIPWNEIEEVKQALGEHGR